MNSNSAIGGPHSINPYSYIWSTQTSPHCMPQFTTTYPQASPLLYASINNMFHIQASPLLYASVATYTTIGPGIPPLYALLSSVRHLPAVCLTFQSLIQASPHCMPHISSIITGIPLLYASHFKYHFSHPPLYASTQNSQ